MGLHVALYWRYLEKGCYKCFLNTTLIYLKKYYRVPERNILLWNLYTCNVHWTFRSFLASGFMNPCPYFHWHAWLGIVDQNWLKLALAKLALGQSISLKVVGMAIPVKITVRSKFPFIWMKYITNLANSTGNLIPLTLDSIVKPQISYFLPILVQNRSTWPTHAQVLSRVDCSMGHVPSDLTRAPKGQHGNLLSPSF